MNPTTLPHPSYPPGWSSWNYFSDVINETLIHQQADALVSTGLRDLGYNYLHLDAGALIKNRTADGKLQVNRTRFPSGMPALSAYIHSRGLKFGMCVALARGWCQLVWLAQWLRSRLRLQGGAR